MKELFFYYPSSGRKFSHKFLSSELIFHNINIIGIFIKISVSYHSNFSLNDSYFSDKPSNTLLKNIIY